ncbi:cyclase family protein [Aliarcobacter cryaerophilus]|uniref:Kynurenine formamidase n=1 Tax=Aliarcobacter cryaerophilus TaxID=28198 RepID=A0AA46N5Y5_9BACT|nr:cyclase family protein [Aliarcobacter cryaerophilus]UYF42480.1 cyclase family protein [Aliarcobacter cryaerophilus]
MIKDISLSVSPEMIVWPNDPLVKIEQKISIKDGAPCNVSNLEMGVHTGTHIDAPFHFIDDGKKIEELNLDTLIGLCYVVAIESENYIKKEHLSKIDFNKYKRILFKTKNSLFYAEAKFNEKFISLSLEATNFLIENKVELIGIDYLSVEGFNSDGTVHREILKNNLVILEGINLIEIEEGEYELICLPLKLVGTDGSPARAILRNI